jgi:hypothetical protein
MAKYRFRQPFYDGDSEPQDAQDQEKQEQQGAMARGPQQWDVVRPSRASDSLLYLQHW